MELYADVNYYKNEFVEPKNELTDDEIKKLLKQAQQKVDEKTYNRIIKQGFDNLTSFQQEKIKNACCYQANYYSEYGTNEDLDISSYTILDINITSGSKISESSYHGMSNSAYSELKQSGLTCGVL